MRFLLGLFLLLPILGQGQVKWVSGYVLPLNGDTLKGEILNEDWESGPASISFRQGGESTRYRAREMQAFGLPNTDLHYVSRPIEANVYRKKIADAQSAIERQQKGHYALQVLVHQGDLRFYRLADPVLGERLFLEKGGNFTELVYYAYELNKGGTIFKGKVTDYLTQLTQAFSDQPTYKLGSPLYQEASLTKAVMRYCALRTGGKYVGTVKRGDIRLMIFGDYLTTSQYVGAGVQLISPRNFGKNFFTFELRALALSTKDFFLPTVELNYGRYVNPHPIQFYYKIGVGGNSRPVVWVIPALGVSYKKLVNAEIRANLNAMPFKEKEDENMDHYSSFVFVRLGFSPRIFNGGK